MPEYPTYPKISKSDAKRGKVTKREERRRWRAGEQVGGVGVRRGNAGYLR